MLGLAKHHFGTENEVAGHAGEDSDQGGLATVGIEITDLRSEPDAHRPANQRTQRTARAKENVLLKCRAMAGI